MRQNAVSFLTTATTTSNMRKDRELNVMPLKLVYAENVVIFNFHYLVGYVFFLSHLFKHSLTMLSAESILYIFY